jgi:hypothetical protein
MKFGRKWANWGGFGATPTARELEVLKAIIHSAYHDGADPVDNPVWSWSALKSRSDNAVFGSLVKKGWAGSSYYEENETIVWITQEGMNVLRAAGGMAGFGGHGADIIVVDRAGNVLETAKEGIPRAAIAQGRFDSRRFIEANLPWSSVARMSDTEVLGVDVSFTERDRHVIRVVVATPEQRGHWKEGSADDWELYSKPGRNAAAKGLNAALKKAMKMIDTTLVIGDLDLQPEDIAKIAKVISNAYAKYMAPALIKYRALGTGDSEGYYHANQALIDHVKRANGWWDIDFRDYL